MGKFFGTDGIRGIAGVGLDAALAFRAGRAAATVLTNINGIHPTVMIARDTRISCDMLEAAFASGLCSAGGNVTLLGVMPTPAVAYLTVKTNATMGVVISASHNPFEHNGIKMFSHRGFKLSDNLEEHIEGFIIDDSDVIRKTGDELGRISGDHGYWTSEYIHYLASLYEGGFKGRIAIDCANGAASETARSLFTAIGADFDIFFDNPNGVNINDECGSTHIEALHEIVKNGHYDIGFAFDGDADRCLAVDERGETIDGDMMLAVLACDMKKAGKLRGSGMVGTIITNAGFESFAHNNGLILHRAAVGDRNVLEMMWEKDCNIGGESSGHLIFSDDSTAGDGQLTALKMLNTLTSSGKKASELVQGFTRFPQVMPGYTLTGGAEQRDAIMSDPRLEAEIARCQQLLSDEGRILIRPSGTEPLIRVLVEAKTIELATETAEHLIDFIKSL